MKTVTDMVTYSVCDESLLHQTSQQNTAEGLECLIRIVWPAKAEENSVGASARTR